MKATVKNIFVAGETMGETTELLRLCQKKNADGCNANGTINTARLRKYIDANRLALETELPDTYDFHRKAGKIKDNHLKDLEIKKMEQNLIEPDEVKSLLTQVATAQSVALKRIMNDLPIKCAGKSEAEIRVEVNKAINDVFMLLQQKIEDWK